MWQTYLSFGVLFNFLSSYIADCGSCFFGQFSAVYPFYLCQSTKLSRPGMCIYNINNQKADDYHKRAPRPLPVKGGGPRRFVGMRWKCISQSFHTLHCFTPTALLFIFNYLYDIFLILRFKYLSDSFHRQPAQFFIYFLCGAFAFLMHLN